MFLFSSCLENNDVYFSMHTSTSVDRIPSMIDHCKYAYSANEQVKDSIQCEYLSDIINSICEPYSSHKEHEEQINLPSPLANNQRSPYDSYIDTLSGCSLLHGCSSTTQCNAVNRAQKAQTCTDDVSSQNTGELDHHSQVIDVGSLMSSMNYSKHLS